MITFDCNNFNLIHFYSFINSCNHILIFLTNLICLTNLTNLVNFNLFNILFL